MQRKIFVLFLVVMLSVVGIVSAQDSDSPLRPIRVGALFDLSGATGDVGTPYAEGVLAYVEWINTNGGIEGRPIELISQDYAYSVETAETLYTDFVSQDVSVFMGWGTGDTLALTGRITEDELPFISASYSQDLNDPMGEAPYNFLVATTYSDQLIIMIQHMADEWVADGNDAADMVVAVFHNDSPFGTDPVDEGEAFAMELGAGGYVAIPMPRGATDFNAELQVADDAGVTHIIVQNVSSPAALLAQNALEFFGEREFYEFGCLNWCADETLINLAGDAAEGALGVIPFVPTTVEVPGQEIPREILGGQEALEEASLHFTQGWAAMDIMTEAIRIVVANGDEVTGPNVKAAMETITDYDTGGLTAPVTFTPEDHRATRAASVFAVEGGVWVEASDGAIDLRDMMMDDMESDE